MEIFGFANIDFKGTEQEMEMFKKLLVLMKPQSFMKNQMTPKKQILHLIKMQALTAKPSSHR